MEVGEISELDLAKEAMLGHMLRKMTEILFKDGGSAKDFDQAKNVAHEMLATINLFESDTVLTLLALWLAGRLKAPCTDEYWQHTLQLLMSAISEAWCLSQALGDVLESHGLPKATPVCSTEAPLPESTVSRRPMLLEIEGILKMGKVREN